MRRVFTILATLTLLLLATAAGAQSLERFKQRLAEPAGSNGARVTATEYGEAASVAARAAQQGSNARKTVRGYRVCIFFDNSPNARAEATKAKELFEENFRGVDLYITYDNPYWRVTAGNCLTAEEAIILKGKLATVFPKAFVKNEELTLADLLNEKR